MNSLRTTQHETPWGTYICEEGPDRIYVCLVPASGLKIAESYIAEQGEKALSSFTALLANCDMQITVFEKGQGNVLVLANERAE